MNKNVFWKILREGYHEFLGIVCEIILKLMFMFFMLTLLWVVMHVLALQPHFVTTDYIL